MSLTPGSRIGSYEIQQLLGEGGMGQVYRGRDTRLGRDVAIKVLPPSVANDPERLARFEREAKLLASLSHTNIAQIYGLEEAGAAGGPGQGFVLVMELAPGEDLTIRVNRGPIDISEALPVALQLTHALEAAHERGIVHRDLKPANIKVSDEGAVKVLDFGLAKAFSQGDGESASAMNSPTLTAQATAAGVILGTAAYMSPEQARGREADKRADVWAFGVVFFEMLTGARMFQGETISDTLAAVLRQDIPWTALPAGTPSEIVKLLRRCLERDRKNRLHDISDARIVLEEVSRGGGKDEAPTSIATPARRTPWLMIGVGMVAALVIGVLAGKSLTAPEPVSGAAATVRFSIKMPAGVVEISQPAVSRDGSFVVFNGRKSSGSDSLYIQRLNESAPKLIERTEGGRMPFVSFDGQWIGYRRANKLERISLDGGEPLPITDIPPSSPSAVWMADNTILFAKTWLGGISAVSVDGGAVKEVSTLDAARGEIGHWFPTALPDARHILITVWNKGAGVNDAEAAVLDLDTGKHTVLFKGAEARYLAPGFIVFFRAGAFQAVRFDPATLKPSGEPVRVVDDAFGNSPEGDISHTDLSANGTLAYLSGPNTLLRELTWIAAGGKTSPMPFPPRAYNGASITRDGTRAAVSLVESGRNAIRLIDVQSGREDPLDLPGSSWLPLWHPDGKRLAYRSMQKGDFDIYWKDVTSASPPEPLLVTDLDESPEGFLPDGKAIVIEQSNTGGLYLPMLMPLGPAGPPKVVTSETNTQVAVSPTGEWMAYISNRAGREDVYVVPIGGGSTPERVSTGGAQAVAWSRDGRELFYLREPEIFVVSVRSDAGKFRTTSERVWSRVDGLYQYNVFEQGADGRMLVAISKDRSPREIRVVVNWANEVLKKVK